MRATAAAQPSRVRIVTELYLRAYWRYYATAGAWVVGSSTIWHLISRK
jgi:hypothetical protein